MTPTQLLLILIATTWASINSIVAAVKYLNETRDKIIMGVIDGTPIDLEYRKIILKNDWIPLIVSCCSICFIYFMIVLQLLIFIIDDRMIFFHICIFICILHLLGAIGFGIFGRKDYKFIKKILDGTDDNR